MTKKISYKAKQNTQNLDLYENKITLEDKANDIINNSE